MAMTRRQAIQSAAAFGAALAWPSMVLGKPGRAGNGERGAVERRDLYPQGVASGDPHPDSVILWTRRPPRRARPRRRCWPSRWRRTRRSRAWSPAPGRRSPPTPTGPAACSSAGLQPGTRLLVPLHRRARDRQPHRPHADRARGRRPRPVRFAFVSCQNVTQGACERLPPDDLRGRARRRSRAPRLRAAPRRLHLRDRLVSGGPAAGHVRPPHPRRRPLPERREDRRLPHPDHARRLPRRLPRLPARPRPAGRARPLAVRLHVGQPRVLVAGAGRASRSSAARRAPRRRARWPPTRPGSSTSRRG